MNQKVLLIVIAVALVAVGAWWFTSKRGGDKAGEENMLAGTVQSIDRENQTFKLNVISEVEVGNGTDIRDTVYTVTWNSNTQFYVYRASADVDTGQAAAAQAGELSRESSIDVQTKEDSGESRTAEIVWIYPGTTESEIEVSE